MQTPVVPALPQHSGRVVSESQPKPASPGLRKERARLLWGHSASLERRQQSLEPQGLRTGECRHQHLGNNQGTAGV